MARFPSSGRGITTGRNGLPSLVSVSDEVNALDDKWGLPVDGVSDDVPAIQAIVERYHNFAGGGGSVTIRFPMMFADGTRVPYTFLSALIIHERTRLKGEQSYGEGASIATQFTAGASGTFTNSDVTYPFPAKFMIKQLGTDLTAFWHGGAIEGIHLDCNNVQGLGGIHIWSPGENSRLDDLIVDSAGSTSRTVSDAVTNATTTITSATAVFTDDDWNAIVTGTRLTGLVKIDRVVSATTAILNVPASGSGSGGTLTVNRPADAIVVDGNPASGFLGSVNGSGSAGALLRLNNMQNGSFLIQRLSGDNNGGGNLRISKASSAADPIAITVLQLKSEQGSFSQNYSAVKDVAMDPAVLIDQSGFVALTILGASTIGNGRDVIRIDRPVSDQGGPSLGFIALEGANPFNVGYLNLVRDSSTGETLPVFPGLPSLGRRGYPFVLWGRDMIIAGGGRIPIAEKRRVSVPLATAPDWQSSAGLMAFVAASTYFNGFGWQNSPGVLNDAAAWNVDLDAGTWEATVLGATGADAPIVSIDLAIGVVQPPASHTTQANTPISPGYVVGQPNTPAGTYKTVVTFVTQDGRETDPSPQVTSTVDGTTQFQVNAPPGLPGAYAYNVYMTQAGGSTFTKQNGLLIGLNDVYKVLGAPTNTGAAPPAANGTISWSSVQGTFDQYAAGAAAALRSVVPGVVVPAHTGSVLVRLRATSHTAPSTAYRMLLSGLEWRRTS